MNVVKYLKSLFASRSRPKDQKSALEEVCVLPLCNQVLMPGMVTPLYVSHDRYKAMAEDVIKADIPLAMSLAVRKADGSFTPNSICGGGFLRMVQMDPSGHQEIFIEGERRLKLVKFIHREPYMKALAESIPDVPFSSFSDEKKFHRELTLLAKRWIFLSPNLQDDFIDYVDLFTQPHQLADFLGFHFLPSSQEKQTLLETTSQEKRVMDIMTFLDKRVHLMEKGPHAPDKPVPKSSSEDEDRERILH